MKLIIGIMLLTAALLPGELLAGGSSGYVEINRIHQRECSDDHDLEIGLKNPHANPDNCSNTYVVNLSCTHAAFDMLGSLALTAMVTKKKVTMWLNGCDIEGQARVMTLSVFNE